MRFIKSMPQCINELLNQELTKLKKNPKNNKEILDLMDMSASFIDGPKIKEEPQFFRKYVRGQTITQNEQLDPNLSS